jgi:hypothetical protein
MQGHTHTWISRFGVCLDVEPAAAAADAAAKMNFYFSFKGSACPQKKP